MKSANRLRRAENRATNAPFIEPDQRPISFLNFYDSILN